MNINPYLLARLYAIQGAFAQSGYQVASTNYTRVTAAAPVAKAKSWEDIVKEAGDGDAGGGGGGTIKGLRGKNDVAGKNAMRKLSRGSV